MSGSKKGSVPRFVLMLQDTKTEIDGPNGRQYYSIQVGFSSKRQLQEAQSELDGRSELQNVVDAFFENVEAFGKRRGGESKGFTAVKVEDKDHEV